MDGVHITVRHIYMSILYSGILWPDFLLSARNSSSIHARNGLAANFFALSSCVRSSVQALGCASERVSVSRVSVADAGAMLLLLYVCRTA